MIGKVTNKGGLLFERLATFRSIVVGQAAKEFFEHFQAVNRLLTGELMVRFNQGCAVAHLGKLVNDCSRFRGGENGPSGMVVLRVGV